MPTIDVYTTAGKKKGKVTLPKEIFAAKVNSDLMAQTVRVYLANQRRAKAKTKTRGEVRGSRRKIWRQKGTGRARHGDRYAPIFVGGGRAHGLTGQENYSLKMSKKMRRAALFSALTSKLKAKDVLVIEGLEKIEPKTKKFAQVLADLKLEEKKKKPKVLLVLPGMIESVIQGAKNLERVNLAQANLLNTYQVLAHQKLVFMKESLIKLKETFLGS